MMFPPGYLSAKSLAGMRAIKRPALAAGPMTNDNMMDAGIFLCGSPDTVRGKLVEAHRRLGFQNFLANLHFATLPADLTEKNLRLFATEVMPALQALSDKEYAGMETQAAE
jgi:alkanesulfonate monooxygenase SsuD/methylene tetrahydromethanopterin reductase-like flavin-dependent oxidoreductase (luciferase family)